MADAADATALGTPPRQLSSETRSSRRSAARLVPNEAARLGPAPVRAVLALLANVTVVAALLVYFGWRRTETQAGHLGIDPSLLDTSVRTYLLRSVGPVVLLLLGVSIAGLLGVAIDRRAVPLVRSGGRRASVLLRLLGSAWLILPGLAWLVGYVRPAPGYVLLPASVGSGVLLALYATELRQLDEELDERERHRRVAARVVATLLAGTTLFWAASNYAEVLGTREARDFATRVHRLPQAVLYARQPLHLADSSVREAELAGGDGPIRYRYTGLRLVGRSGGNLYLVSGHWTVAYGVFFVVRDDQIERLDVIRDRR